jgi:hypothetical protein
MAIAIEDVRITAVPSERRINIPPFLVVYSFLLVFSYLYSQNRLARVRPTVKRETVTRMK